MKDLTRFPIACLVLLTLSLLPLRARAGGYTNLSIAVHFQYQEVQAQATLLQARLDERQRALAQVYMAYELDGPSAQKLQIEIVELQRSLLANHHRMQVELRKAVGRERFDLLRRRLTQIAAPAAAANRESPASPNRPTP